jgi:hypothetical protein
MALIRVADAEAKVGKMIVGAGCGGNEQQED